MSLSKMPVSQVETVKTNNDPKLQPEHTLGKISFEGLPQGSTLAEVARCIHLLEHAPGCRGGGGGCEEGEGCRRTKQILTHHASCRRSGCSVCHQLTALCHHHSQRCQANKGTCTILYCKNKNVIVVSHRHKSHTIHQSEEQTRSEHLLKMKKQLLETFDLLRNTQKLQQIKRLMETNKQAALQLLLLYGRKHKSQPSLGCDMRKQAIGKQIDVGKDKYSQQVINPRILSLAPCRLRLDVLVRACRSGTRLCTDIKS